MKNILILGGSYAGVNVAHGLLKQSLNSSEPFKITIVSPSTHFFWNIAAPRGILPDHIPDEDLFYPIAAGFSRYSSKQFEFIVASAESLDVEQKKVAITGGRVVEYDILVIATGTKIVGDIPLKNLGSTEETRGKVHEYRKRIETAKTIVVAGAGITGVEVAGELGSGYGKVKEIILLSSTPTVLDGCPSSVIKIATLALQSLEVAVKYSNKVTSTTKLPNGQYELTLSTGSKLLTDMYIPTFGLLPNSSYIPTKYLNASGYVMVDEYLRVKGVENAYAVGDVSDMEYSQIISCNRQSAFVAKHLGLLLNNRPAPAYKGSTSRFMGLQIGRNAATGHFGSFRLPSFLVGYMRKNLFVDKLPKTVDGSLV